MVSHDEFLAACESLVRQVAASNVVLEVKASTTTYVYRREVTFTVRVRFSREGEVRPDVCVDRG